MWDCLVGERHSCPASSHRAAVVAHRVDGTRRCWHTPIPNHGAGFGCARNGTKPRQMCVSMFRSCELTQCGSRQCDPVRPDGQAAPPLQPHCTQSPTMGRVAGCDSLRKAASMSRAIISASVRAGDSTRPISMIRRSLMCCSCTSTASRRVVNQLGLVARLLRPRRREARRGGRAALRSVEERCDSRFRAEYRHSRFIASA